jgi:hypothetical protein
MQIYYLLPVVLIAAAVAYSLWMKRQVQSMSPAEAAERFHDTYAGYFDLADGEKIVGLWSGVDFREAQGAAREVAGAALNAASAAVIGVSTYVPLVHVGLTSTGRLLVSREYSEMGDRGHFKQVLAFDQGARATPQGGDKPPKNPSNPLVDLQLVELGAPSGESYRAWLSPQGAQMGHPGFRSILEAFG